MRNSASDEPVGNRATASEDPETSNRRRLPAVTSQRGGPTNSARTNLEERLVRATLYLVVTIAMMMWCCLLPIWWYDILTLVPRVAWQQVSSVYHYGEPVLTDRLERVLVFWPRGFLALLGIMSSRGHRPELLIETKGQLLLKSLFALGFYTLLFFTGTVAKWCAEAGFSLMWFGFHVLFSVAKAILT